MMKAIDAIRLALGFGDRGMGVLEDMKTDPLVQPGPWGGNHAMWIAGHLTVVEGRLQQMLHGTPNPVHHWKPLFDWGSVTAGETTWRRPVENRGARSSQVTLRSGRRRRPARRRRQRPG